MKNKTINGWDDFVIPDLKVARKGSKVARELKPDPFERFKPVLEGIVQGLEEKSSEKVISEFYIGASHLWGEVENWPDSISKFYGQLNYKVKNEDNYSSVESRDKLVARLIKNKWLNLSGVSFKGKSKGFKNLSDRFTRFDGSKIDTKVVKIKRGENVELKVVRRMSQRDYKIKGIESPGLARRFKIVDGQKVFINFVK